MSSKLMKARPYTRAESFNEPWKEVVEPRAKQFAAAEAQQRIDTYGDIDLK
jgi:hypothetical protein